MGPTGRTAARNESLRRGDYRFVDLEEGVFRERLVRDRY